jgi:NTP pyrophosphatase (non-canonical NTP hydrolase)
MNFVDFQVECLRTWGGTPENNELVCGLGIAGEAGEVADIIKKEFFHGHPRDPQRIKDELGDVLHYIAICAWSYGLTLEEVADFNIEKLKLRYPNGFEAERSINRA